MSVTPRKLFWPILVIVITAVVGSALLSARGRAATVRVTPVHNSAETYKPGPVPSRGQSRNNGMEVELITITPHGFEPTEVVRPAGAFRLAIEDRSGIETLSFLLRRRVGEHLRSIQGSRTAPNWNDGVDLEAGQYVLTEIGHPHWSCRLIITAP